MRSDLGDEKPMSQIWSTRSWRDEVVAWVDHRLPYGERRTGPVDQVRIRPWSTLLRVTTDAGTRWLKASTPTATDEAGVYDVLVQLAPEWVLTPLAVDVPRGWLLLPDGGPELREGRSLAEQVNLWGPVLQRHAELQRRTTARTDLLVAGGTPEFSPRTLVEAWRQRTPDAADPGGRAAEVLARAADALESGSVGLALQHDDLHAGNVFMAGDEPRFFDWGDAYVGHPFCVLLIALRAIDPDGTVLDDAMRDRLRDAYLEVWTDHAPLADLARLVWPATLLARIGRALSWERALARSTAEERGEWGEAVTGWMDDATRAATEH